MDSTLVSFVRALRSAGAEPSTSETIDAARAVALIGYGDRAALKAALGMALAKSNEEKQIHDKVFDLYFTPPSQVRPQAPTSPEYRKRSERMGAYRQRGNRFASQSRHEHFERCGGP